MQISLPALRLKLPEQRAMRLLGRGSKERGDLVLAEFRDGSAAATGESECLHGAQNVAARRQRTSGPYNRSRAGFVKEAMWN
jgi:hypothetical protein